MNSPHSPVRSLRPIVVQPDFADIIFRFLETYIDKHGFSPSLREIGLGCYMGRSTVLRYLDHLEAHGRITREQHTARSISIVKTIRS